MNKRAIVDDVNDLFETALAMLVPGNTLASIEQSLVKYAESRLLKRGIDVRNEKGVGSGTVLHVHDLGHPVGTVIHDCDKLDGMHEPLKPGMVVALEPGIYLHPGVEG